MYYTKEYNYFTRAEHTNQILHQQNKHTKYSRTLPLLRLKGKWQHGNQNKDKQRKDELKDN